jgi:fido (protein-threonine AMPylation protein)
MVLKRSWIAPVVMDAELSMIFGDVCEAVGVFAERAGRRESKINREKIDLYQTLDLTETHNKMFRETIQDAGLFRTTDARVMRGSQVAYVAPQPSMAPRLTEELFEWLKNPGEHPLIASAVFHYQLLYIHPFSDGNGRIARLWHSLLLEKWRPALGALRIEEAAERQKANYLLSLERSDRQKSASPFVFFILNLIKGELAAALESTPISARDSEGRVRLSDFMERLLAVFKGKTLAGAEIMEGLGMSHRGTFRKNYLDPAIEVGYVEMTQPDSPRSPTQKYRLTPIGEEMAQKIK